MSTNFFDFDGENDDPLSSHTGDNIDESVVEPRIIPLSSIVDRPFTTTQLPASSSNFFELDPTVDSLTTVTDTSELAGTVSSMPLSPPKEPSDSDIEEIDLGACPEPHEHQDEPHDDVDDMALDPAIAFEDGAEMM